MTTTKALYVGMVAAGVAVLLAAGQFQLGAQQSDPQRGMWATYSTRAPFHVEGGKGTTSKVVKFQLRPDPLAR